ncbi:MAG: Wadjet anti-phage system protein JetD domain-containing protein [Mycobacteriales bacterium]
MSRSDADILDDIATAITSIHSHLQHGPISVEIVMDAVAMRLLEIGEAVKGISPELTATEPDGLYADLVSDRWGVALRLEQERIDWAWVAARLPYSVA